MTCRWPWKRPPRDEAGLAEARRILAQARADDLPVTELVDRTWQRLEENHLSPKFAEAFGAELRRRHP